MFPRYMNGMAQWVGANVQWSYESERYFGKRGLEVKRTRELTLLPRNSKLNKNGEVGPVIVDDIDRIEVPVVVLPRVLSRGRKLKDLAKSKIGAFNSSMVKARLVGRYTWFR